METERPDVIRPGKGQGELETALWELVVEITAPVNLRIDVLTGAAFRQLLQVDCRDTHHPSSWVNVINGEYHMTPDWKPTQFVHPYDVYCRVRGFAYDDGFLPTTMGRPGLPDWPASRIRTLPNSGGELYVFGFNDWGGGAQDGADAYDDMIVKFWRV